ncbi:hypothetical protein [Aquimarina rhabdastrellae]
MKQIIFIISFIVFFSCTEKENKKSINPSDVIIQAKLLSFSELTDSEKENTNFLKSCCYPENWNQGVDCIEKEYAFYVKTKININLLGAISESDTFTIDKLITSNPNSLYGKYVNQWEFEDQNGIKICETAKFIGHNDFNLKRNDSIDQLIIGPLPKKPKKMIIKIKDSKYYKGISPEKQIIN